MCNCYVNKVICHQVLEALYVGEGASARQIVESRGWQQITDPETVRRICQEVLEDNPKAVSYNPRAVSQNPRAESQKPRVESQNPRAGSHKPRAEIATCHMHTYRIAYGENKKTLLLDHEKVRQGLLGQLPNVLQAGCRMTQHLDLGIGVARTCLKGLS